MEEGYYRVDKYIDTFKGKNYGLIPVKTSGTQLNNRFKNSEKWELIKEKRNIDERNDNQCDIDRGSNLTYQNIETKNIVKVTQERSRSGKTLHGSFCYFFEGKADF